MLILCGCPALVPKDPVRGEGPVPQRPPEGAMPDFPGERRRRNGDDWAPGVGQAVTAHLAGDQPGQRTAAARTHDQQVAGAAGQIDQDPASLAPLDDRLHRRVAGDLSPGRVERIPEPPACVVLPDAAQVAAGVTPLGESLPIRVLIRLSVQRWSLANPLVTAQSTLLRPGKEAMSRIGRGC